MRKLVFCAVHQTTNDFRFVFHLLEKKVYVHFQPVILNIQKSRQRRDNKQFVQYVQFIQNNMKSLDKGRKNKRPALQQTLRTFNRCSEHLNL